MDSANSSSGGGGGGDNEDHDSSRGGDDPISDYFIDHFETSAGSQLFLSSLPPTLTSPYLNHNHHNNDLIGPGPSLAGLLFGGSEPGFGAGFPDLVPNTASSPIVIGGGQQNGHFLDLSPSALPTVENPGPGSGSAAPKNPKKRSRASRRAPTTVLATDIGNFRQMVQEFTGIPADPFSRRMDLFSAAASGSALMRPAHFEGPPPLRPSSSAAQISGFLFNTGSGSNPSTSANNLGSTTQDEPDLFHRPILQSGNQTEDRSKLGLVSKDELTTEP